MATGLSQKSPSIAGLLRLTFATRIAEQFQVGAARAGKSGFLRLFLIFGPK